MKYIRAEDRAPKPISTREILNSLYAQTQPQAEDAGFGFPTKAFFLSLILVMVFYYPVVRGYCWLVLVLAYAFGVDSVWPGPYSPFPPRGF